MMWPLWFKLQKWVSGDNPTQKQGSLTPSVTEAQQASKEFYNIGWWLASKGSFCLLILYQ